MRATWCWQAVETILSNAAQPAKAPTAQAWASNALLRSPVHTRPRFMRANWDAEHAESFGPWRISQTTDPMSSLESPTPHFDAAEANPSDHDHDVDPALAHGEHSTDGLQPNAEGDMADGDTEGGSVARVGHERVTHAQLTQAVDEAHATGHALGYALGQQDAADAVHAERAHERELLRHLGIELRALADDPDRYFEPMRRLALHLAEQLVRTELSVSGQAISQLVRQCLATLEPPGEGAVVSLHPDDLERLQAAAPELAGTVGLEADARLSVGSVQVRRQDARIDDLIEHRLSDLVAHLQLDPNAWKERSVQLQPAASPGASRFSAPLNKQTVEEAREREAPHSPAAFDAADAADADTGAPLARPLPLNDIDLHDIDLELGDPPPPTRSDDD